MDVTAAGRLVDWGTAARIGSRVSGQGPVLRAQDVRRLEEDFTQGVTQAEALVGDFTGLPVEGPASRPWVMSRREWIVQNLRMFERILEPLARRVLEKRSEGTFTGLRRKALGFQLGLLLGFLGRKVLGQYDPFGPPDDRDLVYFVAPNVVELERRHRFPRPDFRLWLCLHELTHRVQFAGVPWLGAYVSRLVNSYLDSVDLDPNRLTEGLRRAVEEARRSGGPRGLGFLFLLMTPDQRETFRRMQAVMSLLEGHGNYVMDALSDGRVRRARWMRGVMAQRRQSNGLGRLVQRSVGLEAKASQYRLGERFVAAAVERAGMAGFNRVWEGETNLPTLEEIARPEAWVERVRAS